MRLVETFLKMPLLRIIVTVLLALASGATWAQTGVDVVLQSIAANNKTLQTERQYWEARKIEYRTGLAPENPFVEYDRLPGRPEGAGIQQEFSVTQAFDFPTAYAKRKRVSSAQIQQTEYQWQVNRQAVLLEAKQVCLTLIYLNKRQAELERRLGSAEQLAQDYGRKMEKGDATSLDLNKVKLQQVTLRNEVRLNEGEVVFQSGRLTEMNGGNPIVLRDTVYPAAPVLLDFETLDSLIEATDPVVKSSLQQREITRQQVDLSRALTYPKPQIGYHYQSILGQRYQGVHLGLTLPLWQNRNTVRLQKANLSFDDLRMAEHRLEHRSQNGRLYGKYQNLNASLEEYRTVLTGFNNAFLLEKALRLGEISTIEYLMEITYFYNSYDRYLEVEKEFYQTVAELYKYQL
jgi:outer membrane protein, heavy metal efflux system